MTSPAADVDPFVITRRFAAPRALLFDAFTTLDHLSQWMSPKGFERTHGTLDLRVGGSFHYAIRSPDGLAMWGLWIFREIVRPERLVYAMHFSDAERGQTRHPLAPDWPLMNLVAITFAEDGPRQSTLTLRFAPLDPTEAERRTFEAGRTSLQGGWGGTFDQLDAHLAAVQKG